MLDPSTIVPDRVVIPQRRRWRNRIGSAVRDGVAALVLNLVALAFMVQAAFPDLHLRKPDQAIDVELVTEPAKRTSAAEVPGRSEHPAVPAEAPDTQAAIPTPTKAARPAEPEIQPNPAPDAGTRAAEANRPVDSVAKAETPPPLASEPSATAQQPQAAEPPPTASAVAMSPTVETSPAPATPPPLDQPSTDPSPHLVKVPIAATPPVTPPDRSTPGNTPAEPADVTTSDTLPTGAPPVLSNPQGDDVVPPPSEPVDARTPAERRRQEENTAKLAAALPFNQAPSADPLRAGGAGSATAQSYRAAVYGNFNKAADLFEEARVKHLKGQTVVSFSLDDGGNLARSAVAVSSGNPEVDALALAAIRRAAPYPAPPPGASRAFAPAIRLGLDD